MNKQRLILKMFNYTFLALFLTIISLTLLSVFGIPKNFRVFVVETGSMEPTIKTGSLAFVTPQTTYNKDDIITFDTPIEKDQTQDYVVTHRVVDIKHENGETLFQTKGDANNIADSLWTNKIHVIGKVSGAVPYLGFLIGFTKTQFGFLLFIIIPSLILIYTEVLNINKEFKKLEYKKRKSSAHQDFELPIKLQ